MIIKKWSVKNMTKKTAGLRKEYEKYLAGCTRLKRENPDDYSEDHFSLESDNKTTSITYDVVRQEYLDLGDDVFDEERLDKNEEMRDIPDDCGERVSITAVFSLPLGLKECEFAFFFEKCMRLLRRRITGAMNSVSSNAANRVYKRIQEPLLESAIDEYNKKMADYEERMKAAYPDDNYVDENAVQK